MDKKEITAFFDERASSWDAEQIRNEEVIALILDKGGVKEGIRVLDVASGTGVLFPDYLKRNVGSLTGIDISSKMLEIAKEKFPCAELICDDAETCILDKKYDCIMIYNAFPHFTDPDALFRNLSSVLAENGRLSVAHGASAEEIEKCHSGIAKSVSLPLPEKEKLAEIMSPYLDVDVIISDSVMYMVSGTKK